MKKSHSKEVKIYKSKPVIFNPIPGTLFKTSKGIYRTAAYWQTKQGIEIEFKTAEVGKKKQVFNMLLDEWIKLAEKGYIEILEL